MNVCFYHGCERSSIEVCKDCELVTVKKLTDPLHPMFCEMHQLHNDHLDKLKKPNKKHSEVIKIISTLSTSNSIYLLFYQQVMLCFFPDCMVSNSLTTCKRCPKLDVSNVILNGLQTKKTKPKYCEEHINHKSHKPKDPTNKRQRTSNENEGNPKKRIRKMITRSQKERDDDDDDNEYEDEVEDEENAEEVKEDDFQPLPDAVTDLVQIQNETSSLAMDCTDVANIQEFQLKEPAQTYLNPNCNNHQQTVEKIVHSLVMNEVVRENVICDLVKSQFTYQVLSQNDLFSLYIDALNKISKKDNIFFYIHSN